MATATEARGVTALAPWFGAARMIAKHVGDALDGCRWVGVPFAGGMTELLYIKATTIVVSDPHRNIINLARCVQDDGAFTELKRRLDSTLFHPETLSDAQEWCRQCQPIGTHGLADIQAAYNFFICAWMGRSGNAGADNEFKGNLSTRWNANGGDSCKRFRSAVRALWQWRRVFRRCNFASLDVFDFLKECDDSEGHGLYIDAPWPDDGAKYRHKFTEEQQRQLAEKLSAFEHMRVVIRYGDHPLIRKLYPEDRWQWTAIEGRTQGNNAKAEVLITNVAKAGGGLF